MGCFSMVVVEYKRFNDWEELLGPLRQELRKLTTARKIKKVGEIEQGGVAMEVAINKLGDEGWHYAFQSQLGIFFMRDTTKAEKEKTPHSIIGLLGIEEEEKDGSNKGSGQAQAQKP